MVRLPHVLSICAIIGFAGRLANADDVTFEELLQRLQTTEARVQQIEQQSSVFQNASFGYDSNPGLPVPSAPAVDAEEEDSDDDSELASLTKKWEEKWESQEKTNAELKSALKKAVVVGSSGTKSMKISGRIHADYWGFPSASPGIETLEGGNPQDRLGFRRLRFGVGGDVSPNMGYRIEMEFAGGNATEFRDAYISMKDVSFLQTVIVGNHKRPYGLDHLNSSRYNVFMERPFIIESLNQDSRRLGLSANGVSADEAWNWRYGIWNTQLVQASGQHINDHFEAEFAGRLANTFWYDESSDGRGYGHWAVSGTVARPDGSGGGSSSTQFRHRAEARSAKRWIDTKTIAGTQTYEMIGLEHVLNVGALQITGEYQNLFLQRDSGAGSDLHFHGGYVQAAYFLTGEHIPWERDTGTLGRVKPFENFFLVDRCGGGTGAGWGAWQVAARYSYADFVDDNVAGGIGESFTLGLNWHWNDNTRLQFNYLMGDIKNSSGNSGSYDIIGARFMIDF